jgi:hypothetical protein
LPIAPKTANPELQEFAFPVETRTAVPAHVILSLHIMRGKRLRFVFATQLRTSYKQGPL